MENSKSINSVDVFAIGALNSLTLKYIELFPFNNGYIGSDGAKEVARASFELADAMQHQKTLRDRHLCSSCKLCFASCNADPVFGIGIGGDNVVGCNKYQMVRKLSIVSLLKRFYYLVKNKLK